MTLLIRRQDELPDLQRRCLRASRLALDVEGNGMHAYAPKLCVAQLAWQENGELILAVIDTLLVDITDLAEALGPAGPLKVLHDLTFDAFMLHQAGAPLANVRDTSVTARFLGVQATGLATLLAARFDIQLSKTLQNHDWSLRPLTAEHLEYLTGDVRHLLELDDVLHQEATALDIAREVAVECEYKLSSAPDAGRDPTSAHERIKGYADLDDRGKAVLSRLSAVRESLAEQRDVPPYIIAPNRALVHLAKQRPTTEDQLTRQCTAPSLRRHAEPFVAAIAQGIADRHPPAPSQPRQRLDAAELRLRKALRAATLNWRRDRAQSLGVDLQVVLPGHCVGPVVTALARAEEPQQALLDQLAAVPGFGPRRLEHHGGALLELRDQVLRKTQEGSR